MSTSTKPRSALLNVQNIIKEFKSLNDEMPAQQVEVLFLIARRPGVTMAELSDEVGIALSSVSRNLQALGEWHRHGKPGLGLVETVPDPHERRRVIAFLTAKGTETVNRMLGHMPGSHQIEHVDAKEAVDKIYRMHRSLRPRGTRSKINP